MDGAAPLQLFVFKRFLLVPIAKETILVMVCGFGQGFVGFCVFFF